MLITLLRGEHSSRKLTNCFNKDGAATSKFHGKLINIVHVARL